MMGCYGIGVNRVMAAIAEECQDERGIQWPRSVSPYALHLITVNQTDPKTVEEAGGFYKRMEAEGFEALYDNRNERAGVKFNDADLIGTPLQAIFGEKNLKEGRVDFKRRADGESTLVRLEDAPAFVRDFYSKENA